MWTGRIVLWLVLSPSVGTVSAGLLCRFSAAALRTAIVVNLVCTAVVATGLNLGMYFATPHSAHVPGGVIQWTVCHIATSAAKPELPWLEIVASFGCDRLNSAALLWIPWLALSALLVSPTPERPAWFYGLFCAWESSLLGCFAAYDAVTFLVCDAAALWIGFALLGGWGQGQRRAAAGRFWRHQFAGHAAWCVALIALGVVTAWCRYTLLPAVPTLTWTWHALTEQLPRIVGSSWGAAQYWDAVSPLLFWLLVIGAFVRSPIVPLHAWWSSVATEAPSSVAAVASVAWCPLGLYAWLRFVAPVFRELSAHHAGTLATVGELTAVAAGLLAFSQADLRRFAAYALVSLQGIAWISASTSTNAGNWGALALSQAAGVGCSAWLLLIVLLERRGLLNGDSLNGLAAKCPRLAAAFAALLVCVTGVPALGRGRIDLVVGWTLAEHRPAGLVAALIGCLLVGWGAVWLLQRLLFAPPQSQELLDASLAGGEPYDLTWTEAAALAPLLAWSLGNWCLPLDVRPNNERLAAAFPTPLAAHIIPDRPHPDVPSHCRSFRP